MGRGTCGQSVADPSRRAFLSSSCVVRFKPAGQAGRGPIFGSAGCSAGRPAAAGRAGGGFPCARERERSAGWRSSEASCGAASPCSAAGGTKPANGRAGVRVIAAPRAADAFCLNPTGNRRSDAGCGPEASSASPCQAFRRGPEKSGTTAVDVRRLAKRFRPDCAAGRRLSGFKQARRRINADTCLPGRPGVCSCIRKASGGICPGGRRRSGQP